MDKKVDVKSILKELKTSAFVLGCGVELGYSAGLPVLQIRNETLCLLVPYLKYKITGEVDKTLVYPVKYAVTVGLPEQKPIEFKDLAYDPVFARVDFSRPVGIFRHESIRHLRRDEYFALKGELFALYDKTANMLLYGDPYRESDEARMRELLKLLLEPSLLPVYQALDGDFYGKYLV